MASPFERWMGETRGRVLLLLRRGGRSIAELAAAVGVTQNAVRMHVAALERDGLIEPSGMDRATGGKPARLYGLTAEAEALFPKAYAAVLNGVLCELEAEGGPERVASLLRSVGKRAAAAHADVAADAATRVEAAADALRALGAEIDVEETEHGWRLRGHACPLADVVSEHAEACALAEALVAEVAGLAARERCDRSGRPRCAFELRR